MLFLIFAKKNMMSDFPMIRHFIPISINLGILCCFIHELLHAIILGIVPLIIFMISNNQILNSIMWAMSIIGLVSPSPDYLNVYLVLRQVPKGAFIQDDEDGMCWFRK